MRKIVLLIVFGLILSGCIQGNENKNTKETTQTQMDDNQMNDNGGIDLADTVKKGDLIKVEYIGKFPDTQEVFDKSEGRGPLEFTAGAGQMIKGFDKAVIGMKLNEEKTVIIAPENAYGSADSGQKIEFPLSDIQSDEEIKVGSVLYASNGQQGTVLEIKDGNIAVIEFKHPMAGKTLEFWIKVVEITKS